MANEIVSAKKCLTLTVQTVKMTSELLKDMMAQYVSNLTTHEHRVGRTSVGKLSRSGAKLDSIEITDNNIKDFERVARQYDVDYALKRDKSTEPPTYHVIFQTAKADSFKRAFSEYAELKGSEIEKAERAKPTPEQYKKLVKAVNDRNEQRQRSEKVLERSHKKQEPSI